MIEKIIDFVIHQIKLIIKQGVIHYCVANMPGAYPRASTIALTTGTLKYIQEIATHSLHSFLADEGKMKAINVYQGKICLEQIAMDLNLTEYFESVDERVRHSSA